MAASLRVAGTRVDGTGTSLNPNYPSGIQAGDLILMHAFFHEGTTTTTGSWIVPSGFTLVRARSITVAGAKKGELMVCARRATGSESGAHGSVLRTGGSGNGTVSTVNMTVWQDVSGSTDLDGIEAITDVADESPPYAMTVTTLGSDRLVLAWVFANDNVSSTGASAGWTDVIAPYTDQTGADYAGHVASIVKATAGAQSGSWSQSAGIEGALIGLALIPVPPPSGVNADIAASVLAPIASLSASLGFTGDISASVPSPTTGLSASESFAGDISATVQSPTTSADASWLPNSFTGDVAATISPPVSSASAVHTPQYAGDITASVPAPSSSASASQSFTAVINAAVLSPVSAASALSSGPYVAAVASSVPPPTTALSADNTDPFIANIITSVIAPISSLIASTAEPILGHVRAHHGRMFALNTSVIRMSESTSALRGGIDVGHTVLTIEEDHG